MKKRRPNPKFIRKRKAPSRQAPDRPSGESSSPNSAFNPRVSPKLRPILNEIGRPEVLPFTPDPFQLEAIEKVQSGDVIVSAPTGSGKTYIAEQAMEKVLARGGRAWYASPLKALSNSKYLEFGRKFGPDRVGLLTGDHKVNLEAPIIVGTTEILRNQLYDAMDRGENLQTDLVVIDEAHFLGDPDRGVVWEEVFIYLPSRVRLLLLSATIANTREIAGWLSGIRGEACHAVVSHDRPVPLHPLFLMPDGELISLVKGRSLSPQVRNFILKQNPRGRRAGFGQPPYGAILNILEIADLLPAIFFLKSRSDCDLALSKCFSRTDRLDRAARSRLNERVDQLLEKYPFLKGHGHLKYLKGPGVAAHHAGHLPHWKLLVEHLMQEGLLTAIFSTSTVAAGVNFPARTVVICQSDRFNGKEFVDLTATDLLQMTGRAGRRGMDRIGFALAVPGPFLDPGLVHALFKAPPDPVESQIQINFSMVLNLLMSHRPEQVRLLLDRCLAAYQRRSETEPQEIIWIRKRLTEMIEKGLCPGPEEAMVLYRLVRRIKAEIDQLSRLGPALAKEEGLLANLTPGRLFQVYGGKMYCAVSPAERRGRSGVMAAKVGEEVNLKKGRLRQKWIPLGRISVVLNASIEADLEESPQEALLLIRQAFNREFAPLDPDLLVPDPSTSRLGRLNRRLEELFSDLARQTCADCPLVNQCVDAPKGEIARLIRELGHWEEQGEKSGRLLWTVFLNHLEFLKGEGFVTSEGELTEDGRWAAQLRLDHPLLIAAGIRAQAWPEQDPVLLAATVAPFVVDKEQVGEEVPPRIPDRLAQAWFKIEAAVQPLADRMSAAGFDTPRLKPRAALAIHAWAKGGEWEDAVRIYGLDEGDMAMLVFRAADNLRQLAGLSDTHPRMAPTASKALDLIMREPVIAPL